MDNRYAKSIDDTINALPDDPQVLQQAADHLAGRLGVKAKQAGLPVEGIVNRFQGSFTSGYQQGQNWTPGSGTSSGSTKT